MDALFITHLHLDHIGGVADLLDAEVRIGQVYLPLNAARQQADPDALQLLERLEDAGSAGHGACARRRDALQYHQRIRAVARAGTHPFRAGRQRASAGPVHRLWPVHHSQRERPFRRL